MIINKNIISVIMCAYKYPVISRVGVFGSYARGEQTSKSDIDILYDYISMDEEAVLDILDYGDELSKELSKLDLEVDYKSYKGVVKSNNERIKNNILNDIIWIYEK